MDLSQIKFDDVVAVATALGTFLAGAYICFRVCKSKIEQYLSSLSSPSVSSKVPKQSAIDLEILKRMEQVKELLNADRVHVYEFHNGEHYANGRSALKVSCTYEVYKAGVEPVQQKMLGIPISCIPRFIANILDSQIVKVKDIEEIKEEMPSTYSLKSSFGVEAYTDLIIKNLNGEPVGFIGVQWCDKKRIVKNDVELYRLAAFVEEKIVNNK